jgi:hypothetical protein
MKTIVAEVMLEAEERIKKELKKINDDIEEFSNSPIPKIEFGDKLMKSIEIREKFFEERMHGRMSTKQLTKNYERKNELERELYQITNFKYQHEEWFI